MQDALGPEIASDAVEAAGAVAETPARSFKRPLLIVVAAIVLLQVLAAFVVPPFDPANRGDAFDYPGDAILANFELPAPHVVLNLGSEPVDHHNIVTFQPTIPASLFTGWIVMAVIIVLAVILSRGISAVPGRRQNALEYVYEGLANFATSLGGPAARRYVPIFTCFFLYILLSNWSGLLPFVGRTEQLRAPTSDVNMTMGLALVSFALFHVEGVRSLGLGGYLGKFFSLRAFKDGPAAGGIALFVGFIEFMLEFVKPITLAMRLFGNIYGGEIALGVITALTIAVIPVALVSLEVLLNFVQALIFSILTLMFTLAAVEGHHDDHEAEHAEEHPLEDIPEGNIAPESATSPHGATA